MQIVRNSVRMRERLSRILLLTADEYDRYGQRRDTVAFEGRNNFQYASVVSSHFVQFIFHVRIVGVLTSALARCPPGVFSDAAQPT